MSGKNQIAQFKETYGVDSTFVGGHKYPEELFIVGLDIPLQLDRDKDGYNGDLWDQARLERAKKEPVDPDALIKIGGGREPISVTRRMCADGVERVLVVDGRRKTLGGRLANDKLRKAKVREEEWIKFPIFVDKSKDLDVSVRIRNAGRMQNPPWINAQDAHYMKHERGHDDSKIRASLGGIEQITLDNYYTYMGLCPALRNRVENEDLPKDQRIPFAIAVEIARLGDGAAAKQILAYDYLIHTGVKITGEQGRENAKNLVRAIKSGEIKALPKGSAAPPPAPESAPSAVPPPATGKTPPANTAKTPAAPAQGSGKTPATPPATTPPKTRGKAPAVVLLGDKLSPKHVREIHARLEPTAAEPLDTEAEKVTYAVLNVLVGQDRTGDGLAEWPEVQKLFKPYLRSETVAQ